ncbi:hypothetical protein M9Y10_039588 [Tritrichomonas musculus]|uniref:DUF4371 domain-containing protein n=1 Tax=Tritrichomonas musculus TaxID=1915356 RepID=A0ABR2KBL1_9EUKA
MNLENKNKILLMNNSRISKKYQREIQKNKLLLGKLKKSNNKIVELQAKLNELSEIKKIDGENGPLTLTSTIISELIKNEKINVHARKYSESLKEICFLLFINSNVTYNLLRKFIPLPHPDHLRKIFQYKMKIKKENLLNKNQLEFLLHELHKEYSKDENEPIIAALGFDAATIDPLYQNSTGLFVFTSQPVKGQLRTNIVLAQPNKNGKGNKEIMKTVEDITKAGEKANIKFKFVVSDGDSATNQIHIEFNNYMNKFKGKTSFELFEYVGNYMKPIPVSDWLHLMKNLRTRIIDNCIILFKNSDIIEINKLDEILHLDKMVKASRGRATMRDDLALRLINDENIISLAENEQYCPFVLMLPFVLFTMVIQSENLSISARKELCIVSYIIIVSVSNESINLPEKKTEHTEKVGYLLQMMKIRVLNTILAVAFALQNYSDDIMTSRLGTHIIEYIFGRMRNGCKGFDSLNQCVHELAISQVSKDILEKYDKNEIPVSGRSHPGGSCFSEKWDIEIDKTIDLNSISQECIKLIHHNISYKGSNVQKLISFLNDKTQECIKLIL